MASLGILSGSLSGTLIYLSCTGIYLRPLFHPLSSLCGQPGHIVRLVALLFLLLLLSFPSALLFFSLPPLPPPPPSLFPLLPILFHFSQGACPKWLCPKWQHPFVALAQSGRLSPCRALLAWCHLCFAATPERCTYAPPMPLAPTMPMHVVDHPLNVSWHSPHYFRAHVSYHYALLGFLAQSPSLVLISPLT